VWRRKFGLIDGRHWAHVIWIRPPIRLIIYIVFTCQPRAVSLSRRKSTVLNYTLQIPYSTLYPSIHPSHPLPALYYSYRSDLIYKKPFYLPMTTHFSIKSKSGRLSCWSYIEMKHSFKTLSSELGDRYLIPHPLLFTLIILRRLKKPTDSLG
jgi:hypothetical protein